MWSLYWAVALIETQSSWLWNLYLLASCNLICEKVVNIMLSDITAIFTPVAIDCQRETWHYSLTRWQKPWNISLSKGVSCCVWDQIKFILIHVFTIQIIHRDLAARNVLVGENNTIKSGRLWVRQRCGRKSRLRTKIWSISSYFSAESSLFIFYFDNFRADYPSVGWLSSLWLTPYSLPKVMSGVSVSFSLTWLKPKLLKLTEFYKI